MVKAFGKNKAIMVVLCVLFSICLAVSASTLSIARAEEVSLNQVSSYYTENKEFVTVVDQNHQVFDGFYEQFMLSVNSGSSGNVQFFEGMKNVVEIATCYSSFLNYLEEDYEQKDWVEIKKIIDDAKTVSTISNATFNKDEIIKELNQLSLEISSNYLSFEEKFNKLKAEKIDELTSLKNNLLAPNVNNPQGSELTVVGFYDSQAYAQVIEHYETAIEDIETVKFVKGSSSESQAVVDHADGAIKNIENQPRNQVIRAVNAINDYYFIQNENPDDAINIDLYKKSAREACQKAKDEFISKASADVLTSLSNEVSRIESFPMEDFKPSDFEEVLVDNVQTEDGVFIVRAVKLENETAEAIKIIPEDVVIKVHTNSLLSAVKKNIADGIKEYNPQLTVSYCMAIELYEGSKKWEQVNSTETGGKICYQVEIDLNKYYETYINGEDSGFIENLLKKIGLTKSNFIEKDRIEGIFSADEYLTRFEQNENSSLMYSYNFGQDGKRELAPLNYKLYDGGILMFETNSFGTFAGTQSANTSIFANPIFWIVVALCVVAIIVILVIILANVKYKFIFITGEGASKVKTIKARKGDVFPLPDAPTKEDHVFGGWFLDEACTKRFIETSVKRRKTIKVYAKWYESQIPAKFVKYYEGLRNEIMSYSKVGPLCDTGLTEKEYIARLFADSDGVYLYVDYSSAKLEESGYDVEESDDYENTTTMFVVNDKSTYKEGKEIIALVMGAKGLQFVGLGGEGEPMSLEEREEGFTFVIENDVVAVSIPDYYEYLRIYSKGFALFNPPSSLDDGDTLMRMYMTDDGIQLFLALSPRGELESAVDRFDDTPALYMVKELEDVYKACDYIDKVMSANGFERCNERTNGIKLTKPAKGCGCAYVVELE